MPQELSWPDLIRVEAQAAGVSPAVALAVAEQESSFKADAVGKRLASGEQARGLFQLLPSTAKRYGVDPQDPIQNIRGGVRYLKDLNTKHGGDLSKVLAEYGGVKTDTSYVPGVLARVQKYAKTSDRSSSASSATALTTAADPPARSRTSQVVEEGASFLPAVGGTVGGIVGGIGGTAFGVGVGGVPGAVGGATLGAGAGEAANQLIRRWLGLSVPTTAAAAAKQIATQSVVSGAGPEVVGQGVTAAMKPVGSYLMRSALGRVPKAVLEGYDTTTQKLAHTLLSKHVNVTEGGLAKLDRLITATNNDIAAAIQSVPGTTSPKAIVRPVGKTMRQFASQVNPTEDLAAVRGGMNEFLSHPTYSVPTKVGTKTVDTGLLDAWGRPITKTVDVLAPRTRDLTAPEMQRLKVGTYKTLNKKAYQGELKGAAVETQKALAKGLRQEIETAARKAGINIARMNQNDRALMAAEEAVRARVMSGATDRAGIAYAMNHPIQLLTSVAGIEGVPIRSVVARGLTFGAKPIGGVSAAVIRAAVAALASDQSEPPKEP